MASTSESILIPRQSALNSSEPDMGDGDVRSLFGKILVVVAHQDDETACAVLLQRAREAQVVFATDGAPSSAYFWCSMVRVGNMRSRGVTKLSSR